MNAKTTKKTMNNLQTKPATKYPTGTQEIETNDNEASQHPNIRQKKIKTSTSTTKNLRIETNKPQENFEMKPKKTALYKHLNGIWNH